MKEGEHSCTAIEWKRPDDDNVSDPFLSGLGSRHGKDHLWQFEVKASGRLLEFIVEVLSYKDDCEERKIRTVLLNVVTPASDRILPDGGW